MYNSDIILINQLLLTIERIFEYSSDFSNPDDFVADYKTFDATLMNFVALGETVSKISEYFRDNHNNIEWRKIYAFRNIIAHDYFGIDEEEVFEIIKKHLPKLQIDLQNLLMNEK
jgi:uncharacterized protein with HEPN domain